MHRVAVLAQDGVVALELAIALDVFGTANASLDHPAYEVGVAGTAPWVTSATMAGPSVAVRTDRDGDWAARADTVVVPAHAMSLDDPHPAQLAMIRSAHRRGGRVASLCRGAFIVAATGLLDGRTATTHWEWAGEFARRHPDVTVVPERLFVGADRIWSAAGATAALDLCLHLVEQDLGAAVAATVARRMVAPMRRDGGQAQFIDYELPADPTGPLLAGTLRWAEDHLADDLALADLARHAAMSPRTFSRRFAEGVGTTPMRWLLRTRIRRAREMLERTDLPVDRIAQAVGFRSEVTFRHHFGRLTETTPQRYRRTFGA